MFCGQVQGTLDREWQGQGLKKEAPRKLSTLGCPLGALKLLLILLVVCFLTEGS